ncbi:MAG: UbiX family flavin prenyltransferase [Faecousia sp.]
MAEKRLIVGVSGASGAPLAVALLKALKQTGVETHVMLTHGGELTLRQECGLDSLTGLADVLYENHDIGAGPASGSFKAMGMIVIPCSMKTVAGIHSGYSDNLLLRAADVTLKERRKLVLVARETPLSTIHLRNMYELSQIGAVMIPPMLSYYHKPESIEEMTHHIVGKVLDQFDIEVPKFRRWEGMQ